MTDSRRVHLPDATQFSEMKTKMTLESVANRLLEGKVYELNGDDPYVKFFWPVFDDGLEGLLRIKDYCADNEIRCLSIKALVHDPNLSWISYQWVRHPAWEAIDSVSNLNLYDLSLQYAAIVTDVPLILGPGIEGLFGPPYLGPMLYFLSQYPSHSQLIWHVENDGLSDFETDLVFYEVEAALSWWLSALDDLPVYLERHWERAKCELPYYVRRYISERLNILDTLDSKTLEKPLEYLDYSYFTFKAIWSYYSKGGVGRLFPSLMELPQPPLARSLATRFLFEVSELKQSQISQLGLFRCPNNQLVFEFLENQLIRMER